MGADRHPEIKREAVQRTEEISGCDPHDGETVLVELYRAAYHPGIRPELAAPERIADNGDGRCGRFVGAIRRHEKSAKLWPQAEHAEEICGNELAPHALGSGPNAEVQRSFLEDEHAGKTLRLRLHVAEIGK